MLNFEGIVFILTQPYRSFAICISVPLIILQWVCTELTVNPVTATVAHHIEISQLICIANQLTDFYMIRNTGR